jgi:hypothetical protein
MLEFNLEEWKKKKKIQEACAHTHYRVELTETTNGNPLRRFYCVECDKKDISMQLNISDLDRKIASVKHNGKTLQEIADIDTPYLYWVAVKSKMPQVDRYACARVCDGRPYTVPEEGSVVPSKELYSHYVNDAKHFIKKNGGTI